VARASSFLIAVALAIAALACRAAPRPPGATSSSASGSPAVDLRAGEARRDEDGARGGVDARGEGDAEPASNARDAEAASNARDAASGMGLLDAASAMGTLDTEAPDAAPRDIGPYEIPFLPKRAVFFVVPPFATTPASGPQRLIANLHGVCNPPGYACGYWVHSASMRGFLICPAGNATCGPGAYNAPTWTEPADKMDDDLERAIAAVAAKYPGEIARDGAVLTGFSKGAYVAAQIAAKHPGRWPYLVLNEADVTLTVPMLRAAGVRAVALIAGEIGGQIAGERKTVAALTARGFPAKLWVMPKAGHFYSANIDDIMGEAIDWVLDPARTIAGDAGRADPR
jgi:hypothetical protein